jgi:3-oxoacyl-[acyl-carrier protein] reductase
MNDLVGKAALVTGGSRGIGAAIAQVLAERGADVAITYRHSAEQARSVVRRIEAAGRQGRALQADSADPQAVRAAVNQVGNAFGRLDILVNNAGVFPSGPPEAVTLAELKSTLAIHVMAAFVAAQTALPQMKDKGCIVSIGSCLAHRVQPAVSRSMP